MAISSQSISGSSLLLQGSLRTSPISNVGSVAGAAVDNSGKLTTPTSEPTGVFTSSSSSNQTGRLLSVKSAMSSATDALRAEHQNAQKISDYIRQAGDLVHAAYASMGNDAASTARRAMLAQQFDTLKNQVDATATGNTVRGDAGSSKTGGAASGASSATPAASETKTSQDGVAIRGDQGNLQDVATRFGLSGISLGGSLNNDGSLEDIKLSISRNDQGGYQVSISEGDEVHSFNIAEPDQNSDGDPGVVVDEGGTGDPGVVVDDGGTGDPGVVVDSENLETASPSGTTSSQSAGSDNTVTLSVTLGSGATLSLSLDRQALGGLSESSFGDATVVKNVAPSQAAEQNAGAQGAAENNTARAPSAEDNALGSGMGFSYANNAWGGREDIDRAALNIELAGLAVSGSLARVTANVNIAQSETEAETSAISDVLKNAADQLANGKTENQNAGAISGVVGSSLAAFGGGISNNGSQQILQLFGANSNSPSGRSALFA